MQRSIGLPWVSVLSMATWIALTFSCHPLAKSQTQKGSPSSTVQDPLMTRFSSPSGAKGKFALPWHFARSHATPHTLPRSGWHPLHSTKMPTKSQWIALLPIITLFHFLRGCYIECPIVGIVAKTLTFHCLVKNKTLVVAIINTCLLAKPLPTHYCWLLSYWCDTILIR